MNFDTWYDLYSYPYESREDAAERFADEQGYEDPAEKQGFLDSLPEYETITPLDYASQYDYGFGDWTPPEEAPAPVVSADYEDDPSLWDSTKRGIDLAQASAFGVGEGAGAGFLQDIGLTDASKSLKEWSREGRLRNEAEAATVAPAKSIKEEVAANPDSLYKYLDEDMMTWGQMAEAAPTSLAPFAAALPLALATPYLAAAAGVAATGTLGSTLLSAGVGMGVGNVASSAFVSSEAYERGKSDRIIREQLGVDPDKKFEDLLPSDQQKVDKVATDLSQTSFGHRLYTAGLVEMASYIPYGHAMVRLALDTGLGTASEVWDRTLYSEDAVDALIENGVPAEKAEELREAIIQAGPGFRETLIAAFQQEFVMGSASTGIESLVGKTAPQVNAQATATQVMKGEVENLSKLYDERQQKQIELDSKSQADREKQELRERIQRDQQDRKFYDASLLEELKQRGKEKTPEELAREAEQLAKDREAIQYDLEDTAAFFEAEDTNANRVMAELESAAASEFPGTVEEGREGQAEEKGELKADFYGSTTELRSAKEIEASFKKNLPQSVEALQNEQQVIQEDMARFKKGSDLERAAKKRQEDIKVRIKELTDIEAGKDTTKARLQEKEAITKEEKVLANMEKKIFGVKGEDTSRFGWSAEKFVEYNAYRKRKLKLQQRKEIANPKLQTQEQVQRRKAIQKEEIKAQATKEVDQTIKPSAIQSGGGFGFDLDFIRKYVDDLGKRHEKYKGIYTVLSAGSPQDLANIFLKSRHKNDDGSLMNREQALGLAKQQLDDVNAFVYKGHVYVVAENIKGADKKAAMENLVKIVTFHEPITHLGLKEYLGDDYKPFLDNFYNTNKKDIRNWAENEALTEQDQTPAYLLSDEEQAAKEKGLTEEEVLEFRNNQNRDLAEEFLANKFVELGILDPDILTKTADSLLSVLKGVLDPQNKRVTTVQARSVLAEVQRSYLGGKKNIITGDLFDPANWTMKGFEVEAGEDKVEAYRKYLKEQGIVIEKGEKEFIKKEFAPRPTKPKTVKEEVFKKAPFKIPIYASKRTMTPRQAEVWKANNKKKGKGRRAKNPILMALAKRLETGKASYEEYQKKVDEILPIEPFKSVPKVASDEEILGSIDKGQYRDGLLLGEATLKSGKDVVNVRLDIPAYERYDSWVATITHGKDTIYGAAVRLKDVTFKAPLMGALRIAQGARKYPLATMKGTWQGDSVANIEQMAKDYLNNPAWVQIGYNPERQSSFYLRENKTINGQEFEKGTPISSADEIVQVGAFVLAKNITTKATPSKTVGDVTFKYSKKLVSAKDFKTIKPPNLRFTKLQRKIYALLKTPAKGIEYTRKYLNRKDHPSPTNKSQAFELPNGHKVWLGSGKTVDNWIEQVESVLTPAEIKRERNWYPKVKKLFEDTFGKDDAPKMILAWALGNKAESPLGAMKNVLRARENLAKKINKDLMKKGGLNDAAITSILKDLPPEGGSGVKLFDFVDASIDSTTRVWTGHDSRMGGPAVVDRHTWRDGGYLDDALLNILKEGLPNDPRVKKLKLDREKPSVTDAEYEQTAMWLRDITIALNAKKFAGVNNWTPNAVQAVGWMSMAKITGQAEGGTAVQAIRETTRDVLFEITPGTNAPLLSLYPQFKKLTDDQRRTLASKLGDVVTDIALKETGVLESVREKGTGWYLDTDAQPNILTRVNASKDGLLDLIHIIGYLAQQDSVLAYGAQSNARQIGIDFVETDGKFSDTKLLDKFYKGLRKAHPNYFSGGTEGIVRGKPVFRALLFDPQAPLRLKVGERKLWIKKESNKIIKEITPTINQLAKDLDLSIRSKGFAMTTISADNNWTENTNGELYTRRIVQRFRPHISRRILDNGPKKVEKAIQKQFDKFGIKYSKRTDDGVSGRTAQRPYEGRLDVESDGQSHFVHWSKSPDLIETDPSYHGTGIAGRESENKRLYPDIFVPRTYIGLPSYSKEGGLGKNMYEIQLDPNTLYDGNKDPDGLFAQVMEEMGLEKNTALRSIKYENSIKEAGYAGYFNQVHKIAALFHPTKVNFTKEISGPSTYVPSIRGDQGIKYSKRMAQQDDTMMTGLVSDGFWKIKHSKKLYNPVYYEDVYKKQKGIFYRGSSFGDIWSHAGDRDGPTGVGSLGAGVYLSPYTITAEGYARVALREQKAGMVYRYKVKKGLKIADANGKDIEEIRKRMGVDSGDWREGKQFALAMRRELQEKGYDGAYSTIDTATGLVIFDEKNIKPVPWDDKWLDYVNNIKYSKRLAKNIPPRDKWLQYISGQQEGFEPVGRPDTPEWNEFMEGSKIKYPLYHGTPLIIEKRYSDTQAELEEKGYEGTYGDNIYSASFQFNKLEPGQFNYTGLHLSSEPEYANMYADKDISMDYSTLGKDKGPNVIKGFVNVKNPLKLEVTANVKNWKKGVSHLREKIKKSGQDKSGGWLFGSRGSENYVEFEFLDEINKKENIKMKERLIKLLDPETFFGKEERKAMSLYTFNRLDLRPGESQNKEFLEYVTMQLEQEMPYHEGSGNVQQEFLDAAMNTVIVHGMGHDALLYVQEIGDMAPRPFIGVMLLDPQYTQIESEKSKGFVNYNTDAEGMPSFPFRSAYNQKPNDSNDFKFSKRVKNYSPEELVSEWRANIKGKVKGKLPEEKKVTQKDKVTISKEAKAILSAKATRADISPKAILDPEGNIKTSKILASRASMFALRSGGVNTKDMPWRYRLAERLTRSITPQGTLPDRLKYLAIRRLIKGKIKGAEDASKALYNILKNTKQADVIYKYFTTRDFDANKITNKAEREAAIDAKARIDEIGDQLVKSDLLDEGAREQYKGMYLPQVYLKYLLKEGDNPFIKVRGGGGIQIDQNYLKKRLSEEDLPKEIRELVLGQIKDPAYLASKAISIPAKDMAILDWLQQIAGNEDWVAKDSLVSFDTFAEIRKAKLPLEVQKALELKDTKGVKVSGHWLKNESERIWGMIPYMNLDKADMDIVEKLVTDMAEVSNKAFDKPYDDKLYAIVPKTKKYGMLAGMALRKEIANDIFGGMNMQTGDMSMAENILGDGGKLGSFNRFWKWSKVSANPPSWVRNFVSNMILMNMGGVPFWKMPGLIKSSLADMQGKGKYKGQLHQLAKDLGLTAGNFSNVELGRIEREFKDLQIRMKNKGGPMNVIGMIKGAFNKVHDTSSDWYGGIDTLGKMMILKHSLDKNKIKIKDLKEYGDPGSKEREALDDIAYNAEKWLFDYSNVLPSVKYLRNVPFGAPFASFTSFVAPLMLETAITKPWKFLPYYALGYAMKELFKDEFELDDEQYEGLKVSMSDYLREKAYGSIFPTAVIPFPFLDANKRIQFMDVSYLYPWGMFSEMAGEIGQGDIGDAVKTAGLLGSPGLNIASAIMTGIDPFTRKQIVDETGTNEEKAADLIWYVWNLSAPPMLHGIWQGPGEGYGAVKRLKDAFTGALAKDGEAKFTKGQAVGRMFGMNITPIAVPEGRNKHLRWEYSKHNKLVYKAKREISNMLMMQMDMGEIKKEGKKWGEKILKSQEEFREKVRISTPPITLLREREKFLREKARSAQQYRASL